MWFILYNIPYLKLKQLSKENFRNRINPFLLQIRLLLSNLLSTYRIKQPHTIEIYI